MLRRLGNDYIYSSALGEISIPNVSIYDFMFRQDKSGIAPSGRQDDRLALIDEISGRTLLFHELRTTIDNLARSFYHDLKIRRDDVVVFYGHNNIEYVTSMWALLKLGAIMSGANPAYTQGELSYQIKVAKAKFVFAHSNSYDIAIKAARECGLGPDKVTLLDSPSSDELRSVTTIGRLEALGAEEDEAEYLRLQKNESSAKLAFLSFSSGTSGLPKGVKISHRNIVTNVCQLYEAERQYGALGAEQVISCSFLPFYHVFGLVVVLHSSLYNGAALCIMPNFEPNRFLESVRRYRVTQFYMVPPALIMIMNMPTEKLKLDFDVKQISLGAAPLGASEISRMRKIWPHTSFRQGYGLTETCTTLTRLPFAQGHHASSLDRTVGTLLPSLEFMVVDPDTLQSVGPGTAGELWVRAPNVALGYYENEKATKDTFNQRDEGWMRTGDEVVMHEEEVYIREDDKRKIYVVTVKDRLKEMIKVLGMQVAPAELESLLLTHPDVADCCVIGVPHPTATEVPFAFVVPKRGVKADENAKNSIIKFVAERKIRYKHIAGVKFVPQIHKSGSGKILRRIHRDEARRDIQGQAKFSILQLNAPPFDPAQDKFLVNAYTTLRAARAAIDGYDEELQYLEQYINNVTATLDRWGSLHGSSLFTVLLREEHMQLLKVGRYWAD